jgi:Zn-dependent protease/predicted transcriptional regulator
MRSDRKTMAERPQPSLIKGYRLFRLFGFDIKLNLTWLLLGLLITWTLAAGLFPTDYPGLAASTYWWMGVAGAVGILFSIVFHELSHSLVARHFGLPMGGITLFIFGGVAEMKEEPVNPKVEFLMAVAGPLASLVLALFFWSFERLALGVGWPTPLVGVGSYLAYINLLLAVFNLLPAFPLDGGRMLRAALWFWRKDLLGATQTASQIGSGFGLALMFLGVLAFIQGQFIGGMWWLLIGAFLRSAAAATYRQLLVSEMLRDKPVRDFMQTQPVTVSPDIPIQSFVDDYVYHHHFKMFPVVDNGRLFGCITTRDIKQLPRDQWPATRVSDLTAPCSDANTVSPDMPAGRLITEMSRPGANSRYIVVDGERLVGVISLRDLKAYIALKLELEPREF